jgi:hypothetical protein
VRQGSGDERLELVPVSRPKIERLLDQQRLVEKVGIGRNQRLSYPISSEVGEGEESLEARDTTANDDDAGAITARIRFHLRYRSGPRVGSRA